MNITFTATFDNIADFNAFVTGLPSAAPRGPSYAEQAEHLAEQDDTVHQVHFFSDDLPAIGTSIHWHGQRFEFDGVVESVDSDAEGGDKCVWVRRNDTGNRVSLTANDLYTGKLTAL